MKKEKGPSSTPPRSPLLTVPGFRAGAVHSGIKKGKARDLALIVSDPPAHAAAVFTRNPVQAAPVLVSRARVRSGSCSAVLVNSGNANACTGDAGLRDAVALCRRTAEILGVDEHAVLPASTGVIGERLPVARIRGALPRLVRRLRPTGLAEAADAIRTTDRFRKFLWVRGSVGDATVTLCGMVKGAGMIRPDMATMLAFFCTDLRAPTAVLRGLLRQGADLSFNRITVDGDTSTNDMVLLLANGLAGNRSVRPGSGEYEAFRSMLFPMMRELAEMIVRDGEGATKVVEIRLRGARSRAEARRLAYHLAGSSLVKTSFYGRDPNWGRIMAALGSVGAKVHPQKVDIAYDDVLLVREGLVQGPRRMRAAERVIRKPSFTVTVDLHLGTGCFELLTSDLTHDYVTLNAAYRS